MGRDAETQLPCDLWKECLVNANDPTYALFKGRHSIRDQFEKVSPEFGGRMLLEHGELKHAQRWLGAALGQRLAERTSACSQLFKFVSLLLGECVEEMQLNLDESTAESEYLNQLAKALCTFDVESWTRLLSDASFRMAIDPRPIETLEWASS